MKTHKLSLWPVLLSMLMLFCVLELCLGTKVYSLEIIWRVLSGEHVSGADFAIRTLRLPRMVAGFLAGVAFGLAGSTCQTLLRNPLASPDVLGVTTGASLAAVFCILVLHLDGLVVSLAAVLMGLFISVVLHGLSRGTAFSGTRLILVGIAAQALLGAAQSFLLLRASQYDITGAMRWLSGSLNGMRLSETIPLGLVVVCCGFLLMAMGKPLTILMLGEESAVSLGLRTEHARGLLLLASVVLTAFATAITGPISFVAFLAGPIASRMVRAGSNPVPLAGLVGALLVLGADLIGQHALPDRFPVGVITGMLGAPVLIVQLIRMNRKGGVS